MNSSFILLDLVSGNVITDFPSECDAWDALRAWASDDGLAAIADLSLMRMEDGHPALIAMEDELVRRVADGLVAIGRNHLDHADALGRAAS